MTSFFHSIMAIAARRALPVLRVLAHVAWVKVPLAALPEEDKR